MNLLSNCIFTKASNMNREAAITKGLLYASQIMRGQLMYVSKTGIIVNNKYSKILVFLLMLLSFSE